MAEPSIFDGITLFDPDSGIHDQVSAWGTADRDSVAPGLSIFGGGTENHKQGWELAGLAQFLAEADGRTATHHLDDLDAGVEHVIGHVRAERTQGQCRKEVMSSTYWPLSALYRVGALRETFRLIDHFPAHQGLRELAGELVGWVKIHRWLLSRFRASNGLIRPVGIRQKAFPEIAGGEFLHLLSHCWDQEVTEPVMRALLDALESPSPEKLQRRTHAVIAVRLYRSPEGRRIEELTRGTVQGRLSTEVAVTRQDDGWYSALMPQVEVIAESRGMPPQVVWDVTVDGAGNLIERIATNDLAHPPARMFPIKARRGDTITHPLGLTIPDGWLVIGPDTPMPEAPPWNGEAGGVVTPPDPEPLPEEPTPEHPEEEGPEPRPGSPTPEQIERARELTKVARLRTTAGMTGRQAFLVRQRLQNALALLAGREPKP